MRNLTLVLAAGALLNLSLLACTSTTAHAEPAKGTKTKLEGERKLARTGTAVTAATIGKPAPNFTLTSATGTKHSLTEFKGKYVILEWVNYDCPFVAAQYGAGRMQKLQKQMTDAGVIWLSINTGPMGKQGVWEGQALLDRIAKEKAVPTAYLRDPDGAVGKLFGAKTTPHMYLISPEQVLLFAGGLDGKAATSAAEVQMEGSFIEDAYAEASAGKAVSNATPKPYGCGVKYP